MRKLITTLLVTVFAIGIGNAQSLEEGIKLYQYQRYQSAVKQLESIASSSAQANYYYGLSELALGNTAKAQSIFSKYPEDYANLSGMARVEFAKGNETEGMKLATALAGKAKRKNWEPKKYAADAITYSEGGDKQQAVTWYEDILEDNETADILLGAGDAYQLVNGGGGKAMNSYEDIVEKDASNSLAFSRIGKLWYNAKNYELALENWEKAKKADPENPLPYRDLANAYSYVGKYDAAKNNLEEFLKRSDKSDENMVRYVETLYQAKDCPAAISKIQELKAKGVFKPNFYGILAYCYMEEKDSVSAVKALENVRKYFEVQDKKKIYTLDNLNYGRIALKNNLSDTANFYFNKALTMDTAADKSATMREIADAFKANRDWLISAEWFKKIYDTYGADAKSTDYFWAGIGYYYGREYAKGDESFAGMYALDTTQPHPLLWRGKCNAAIDNEAKNGDAAPHFEGFLAKAETNDRYEAKEADKMFAYQYLALYYYNSENFENARIYVEKILAINEKDELGNQIKDFIKGK
ncbi:MAG: hypothetical protein H6551_08805 [Chitinophagales bacterium]|nr:hypothetical protein [Chitinophagaceae bacterium]MCB9065220.1 hypothetical protein [Chitinophagales bacterium]